MHVILYKQMGRVGLMNEYYGGSIDASVVFAM